MPLIVKINVRHTRTGNPIRTIRLYNNFTLTLKHNSLASTFSFDYLYDPKNQNDAEMMCVSHMHECQVYYTTNQNPNYQVQESDLELTGYLVFTQASRGAKPQMIKVSGYSKAGTLHDCDPPPDMTLESEGLSLKDIIDKVISPFGIGVVYDKSALDVYKKFASSDADPQGNFSEAGDGDDDDNIGKSAPDSNQNVAAYLIELAKARNIVLKSNAKGELFVAASNTKSQPILIFDYGVGSVPNTTRKIPGVLSTLTFNAQALHTHITVKQQADDTEGANGSQITLRNPLIPVNTVYRPKTHIVGSGNEFTVKKAAKYEMSKEIRDAIKLEIEVGLISLDGHLIRPDNIVLFRDPENLLYTLSRWFIQETTITKNEKGEVAKFDCVLPFAYDFDVSSLKNVFVEPHENFPRL